MSEMSRNEHFIRNILALVEHMFEQNLEEDIKKYIYELEFKDVEKNSLYAKCIYELKHLDHLNGKEYENAVRNVCCWYLSYETGERFNLTKYNNDYRKQHYKQLNVDIPKEKMETFENILKQKRTTKKKVVLQWIDDYIEKNK